MTTRTATYRDIYGYLPLSVGHAFGSGLAGSLEDELKMSAGLCSLQEAQGGKGACPSSLRLLAEFRSL